MDHLDVILSGCHFDVILLGDFNLDINWSGANINPHDARSSKYVSLFENHNLKQFVNTPTCGSRTLDLVLSNNEQLISEVHVRNPLANSDHFIVAFSIHASNISNKLVIPYPDFANTNFSLMKEELSTINWEALFDGYLDIDDLYSRFCNVLHQILDKCVPLKTSHELSSNYPIHIKKLFEYRNFLFYRLHRRGVEEKYSRICNKLSHLIDRYTRNQEKRKLEKMKDKELYNFVNRRIRDKPPQIPDFPDQFGRRATSNLEKSEILADYFSSVLIRDDGIVPDYSNVPKGFPPLNDFIIMPHTVVKQLRKLKVSYSITFDGIPQTIFLRCRQELCVPLAHIFNCCLRLGSVPTLWKKSIVTPINKHSSPTSPQDFRPISITSTAAKIMERCVKEKIDDFLDSHGIIPMNQFGFSKNSSTTDILLQSTHDWTMQLSKQKCIDIIYFDISKAFDTVSHQKLLRKLEYLGISGNILKWLESFLVERTFSVKIHDSYSNERNVTSGVPQGSVLGPLLFNIYLSDLPATLDYDTDVKLLMFADDIKMYACYDEGEAEAVTKKLQGNITKLMSYMRSWQLTISLEKTKVMYVGSKNPKKTYFLQPDSKIDECICIKDLGITYDNKLSYAKHIEKVVANARTVMFRLLRIFKNNFPSLLCRLFKLYVRPVLEHNSVIWNPHKGKEIALIESVQRTFTRIVCLRSFACQNSPTLPSYMDRLRRLNLNSLVIRRGAMDLHYLWKIWNRSTRLRFSTFFVLRPCRGRTANFNFYVPAVRKERHFQSYFVRISRMARLFPLNFFRIKCSVKKILADKKLKDLLQKNINGYELISTK
ncbi:hypothetical protein Y032_0014g2271 [Ancylostoma ceylanicum]|nr:hypothetical protein Y032_0014g2271 [Ancylostoma ceylanicum]